MRVALSESDWLGDERNAVFCHFLRGPKDTHTNELVWFDETLFSTNNEPQPINHKLHGTGTCQVMLASHRLSTSMAFLESCMPICFHNYSDRKRHVETRFQLPIWFHRAFRSPVNISNCLHLYTVLASASRSRRHVFLGRSPFSFPFGLRVFDFHGVIGKFSVNLRGQI